MLEANKTYRNKNGDLVHIGGRITDYCDTKPFVWSVSGKWYDESTGRYVLTARYLGFRLPVKFTGKCIENHNSLEDGVAA